NKPYPVAKCKTWLDRLDDDPVSGAWFIEYNISKKDSTVTAWMRLEKLDGTPYKTLAFKARSKDGKPIGFYVEMVVGSGGGEKRGQSTVEAVTGEWTEVRIPLEQLNLPALAPLTELRFIFRDDATKTRRETLIVEDIDLRP
ncbi:MAG: LamG domain-containing protein, partial [candidate division Zixibacteria bacterium]|nr:LamG domain-containing protein [candidate division Zixibacteria bacterium]